ncbi:MAG: sodium/proline symporter [candidate division WOR-3 bacterium]
MNNMLIYAMVIVLYLLLLLVIGIISGRKTKDTSDFYLGGRNIGPWVTSLSYVAAYFSSVVIIGGGAFGWLYGMSTLWIGAINVLLGTTVCWIVLGPRMREITHRLNVITIPEFLKRRYDSNFALIFSSLVIAIFLIVYNVSMLKGMGHIFEGLIGVSYIYGLLISSVIILFYVSIGGYIAVVWTSFIQAWIMGIGLITLTIFTLKSVGGISNAAFNLSVINKGYVDTPGVWNWQGLISYALIVSFGVWGMPQLLVRFYSIKKISFFKIGTPVAALGTCLALLPYFNGAISRILFPSLKNPDLAIPMLVKSVLNPIGSSIFLAAVLAAGMSTFSSVLIIITGSIIKDFLKEGLKLNYDDKRMLTMSKITTLIIGIISIIIAIKPPALVLALTAFSWAIISSTTLWPVLFGLYARWVTKAGVISSMIGGFLVALIWMALKQPFKVHGFIPGIIISFMIITLVSLFTKKYDKEFLETIYHKK